jgi:hypothetical protein
LRLRRDEGVVIGVPGSTSGTAALR